MNKEKFLKELEKKLQVLSDSEKEDIINEYRDIIEEKIKHGKKEDEAIKEFGDIDKLAEEILSAYKINPEYGKNEKSKGFVSDCENLIKEGAKKLSDVTDEVVDSFKKSNIELTTENIFEIIIKVILVLLGLAILKLPFYVVSEIGSGIFNVGLSPFNQITSACWKVIVEIIYIIVCILVIIAFISKYTNNNSNNNSKDKKETRETKKNENKKELVKKEEKGKKKQIEDTLGNFLLLLSKLFVLFIILFPIWMIIISLLIVIACIIYFLIKGIAIYGFLILTLAITGILITLSTVIYNLLFNNKKTSLWPLLINFILFIIGCMLSFDYIINLEYYDELPNNLAPATIKYDEVLNGKTYIPNGDYELVIDNNLEDNHILVEINYYDEFETVNKHRGNNEDEEYINFYTTDKNSGIETAKKVNKLFIDNLKANKIYNYSLLNEMKIKIYINENTKELIY